MKRGALLSLLLLGALHLAQPPAAAESYQAPLALELGRLRDAWLRGDTATSAARLDAMLGDNRLKGELPRWVAYLRAWLALEEKDEKKAIAALQGVLRTAEDAREYVRAARLLVLWQQEAAALTLARQGLARGPYSDALRRLEADLLYLSADHTAALAAYESMVAESDNPRYPYLAPRAVRWQDSRRFAETDGQRNFQPEPHASLVAPLHWFSNDLPGLDRCILELSRDAVAAETAGRGLPTLVDSARQARNALATLRTGDAEQRRALEVAARRAEFKAACAARVAALALLAAAKSEQAAELARSALEVAPEDVALLDLYVIALSHLGRAEELRQGPLAQLRVLANLHVTPWMSVDMGVQSQMPDRVFAGALALYRVNPQAGERQFSELVPVFGAPDRAIAVRASALGVWLFIQGEPELARRYLHEASRMEGVLSGRPIRPEAQAAELALLALGEGTKAPDEAENPAPAPPDDEDPAIDVGDVDGKLHALLRAAPRAGGLAAAQLDTRVVLMQAAGMQIWSGGYSPQSLLRARRALPGGAKALDDALYSLPARIAAEVPGPELESLLSADSTRTKLLHENLAAFGDAIARFGATQDWQARNQITQKAAPILGMIEAHATLLRAKLLRDTPADIAALTVWLAANQPTIDLRRVARATSAEDYVSMAAQRRAAGIPEVVHSGLLLDAAVTLARAGRPGEAALLIWHNRDVALGLVTREALASLGAALAAKAGKEALRARLELAATMPARRQADLPAVHPVLRLLETPSLAPLLREFGGSQAVVRHAQLLSYGPRDGETDALIIEHCPEAATELRQAPEGALALADELFRQSLATGQCAGIRAAWPTLVALGEPLIARRLAAWVIICDLPLGAGSQRYYGLADASDVLSAWVMLLKLQEAHEGTRASAARTRRLLQRCASPTDDLAALHPGLFN